jgi:cysteine synthase
MQQDNSPQAEMMSYNTKMIGADVHVIKNGGWRGKVESVVDEEYFMVSQFNNPSNVEKVSMYDIRSLSYETL